MDDTLKIQALMVYFNHWGKQEARIYKSLDGIKRFQEHVNMEYSNRYKTALEVLRGAQMGSKRFWHSMVHCLLPGMDHWVKYDYFPTTPLCAKIRFAENIGTCFYNVIHVDMTDDRWKSVDAIVALPPVQHQYNLITS